MDRHEEQDHRDSRPKPDGRGRTYSVPVPSCMCETCGKVLNNTRALASHMLIHKVYQCKLCTAQIVGLSAFDTHKRNAHPEEHPRKETGVYSCEVRSRNKKLARLTMVAKLKTDRFLNVVLSVFEIRDK